ncbi:MAG: tetratricopeptide repeat protein, partial [Gemmataceae bacterium]
GAHFASVDAGLVGHKTRHNLAVLYFEQGRHAEAEAQWQQCLQEQPHFLPALIGLGELALRQQRWDEVERIAVTLDDGRPLEASVLRARAHLGRSEHAQARHLLEEIIQQAPSAIPPRRFLSYALLQEGKDPAAAENALRELLALEPNDPEATHNLQVLLGKRSD